MNFKDLINKAKSAISKNPGIIDKGADAVDKATKGKYSSHVDKGAEALKDAAKKLDGQK
ncbi:antitoxin [Williamsia sp. CHRR-6]|uniref:antitoxin n=1 Tax=Williamsia sp. CHRR-6 TaxID=2835871 RepID=UPI001BD9AAA1|nr:antitoxin [Williamsia sp. CHRR-6]MBT0566515.1 antitoxin [Williamsia sp. CHRR-6]